MIRAHEFFTLKDKTQLRIQVQNNNQAEWLIVLHGLGEHFERHSYISEMFSDRFNILFYDHRGHGMSGGKRATIEDFETFGDDLEEIVIYMKKECGMKGFHFFAHSMGSLIACDYYQRKELKPSSLFLSSPPVGFPGVGKIFQYSPTSFTKIIKDIPMSFDMEAETDSNRYSHDPTVQEELLKDPLVNQHTESKLAIEILHKSNELFSGPIGFDCPVSMIIGSEDKVVCSRSAVEYFSIVERVKRVIIVPGGYHELYKETPQYSNVFFESLYNFFTGIYAKSKNNVRKLANGSDVNAN